ncbi:MAG: alanine racemase [Patescibacteria group bacterium]|nr:alanine racemase [Patescibacteria group bacterium]MDD5121756.1 alanine racemase [Patescibacteria group bacterium]
MLTSVEIKKSAIKHNLGQIKKIIGPKVRLMVIVKSNAYGHGLIEMAKLMIKSGVNWLGVINDQEALILRQANIKQPIFILSFWDKDELPKIINKIYNCDFPVYTLKQAKFLSRLGKKINVHLKIDTGTSRIGIKPEEAIDFIKKIKKLPNLNLRGIFTHYAASENKNQSFTNAQTKKFTEVIKKSEEHGIKIKLKHAACSAAAIVNPPTRFNLIRVGIAGYGLWPSPDIKNLAKKINIQPALTWKTKIIQIKELSAGISIGYDRTYKTKKKTKIAVLPIGYWDGYDRRLSGRADVLISGQRCPVRGRVCMNLTMVEISKLKDVRVGDEVVLLGRQGK